MNQLYLTQGKVDSLLDSPDSSYSYVCSVVSDIDVKTVMDNVKSYVIANPSCNYSAITALVAAQETYARANIIGSDLDITLTFLRTFEKSSYLWTPVPRGGLGLGLSFFGELPEEEQVVSVDYINWNLIAWSDGAGAARALYLVWVAAAGGPIGWAAAAGGIGMSAAYASGATLLGQLLLT